MLKLNRVILTSTAVLAGLAVGGVMVHAASQTPEEQAQEALNKAVDNNKDALKKQGIQVVDPNDDNSDIQVEINVKNSKGDLLASKAFTLNKKQVNDLTSVLADYAKNNNLNLDSDNVNKGKISDNGHSQAITITDNNKDQGKVDVDDNVSNSDINKDIQQAEDNMKDASSDSSSSESSSESSSSESSKASSSSEDSSSVDSESDSQKDSSSDQKESSNSKTDDDNGNQNTSNLNQSNVTNNRSSSSSQIGNQRQQTVHVANVKQLIEYYQKNGKDSVDGVIVDSVTISNLDVHADDISGSTEGSTQFEGGSKTLFHADHPYKNLKNGRKVSLEVTHMDYDHDTGTDTDWFIDFDNLGDEITHQSGNATQTSSVGNNGNGGTQTSTNPDSENTPNSTDPNAQNEEQNPNADNGSPTPGGDQNNELPQTSNAVHDIMSWIRSIIKK